MNDSQLKQLLREADAGAASAVSESPLDVAVLESHAARRRTRQASDRGGWRQVPSRRAGRCRESESLMRRAALKRPGHSECPGR